MVQQKILVLDDDPDLLEIMTYLLTEAGYLTLSLSRGDQINKHILQFGPDLIVMDIMLSTMDGREICKQLKADIKNTIPVVLISGSHHLSQVMDQVGAPNAFLAKPFDIDHFLKCISDQLK